MRKLIKIGAAAMMLLALTGCSSFKGLGVDTKDNPNDSKGEATVTPIQEDSAKVPDAEAENENENNANDTSNAAPVVLMLDPGHGGGYSGASYNGRVEKEMTLKVASYVKEYLEDNYQGITIYMTRDTDTALDGDVAKDLEARAQAAQDVNADLLVSFHFNATDSHDQTGAMVIVSHRDNVATQCTELGNSILTELAKLGLENDGLLKKNSNDMMDENGKPLDYYAINRHCANRDIPGIIVEHCYMDNASDEKYISSDDALNELAKADAVGIANYLGLTTK